MKKIISLILCLSMIAGILAGCGQPGSKDIAGTTTETAAVSVENTRAEFDDGAIDLGGFNLGEEEETVTMTVFSDEKPNCTS